MIATKDIAWLGGLLEGEGCFMHNKGSPVIALSMTDRDTVERAASLLDVRLSNYVGRRQSYKDVYTCRVHGYRATAWMMTLYQFFGERRQEKIRSIIKRWKLATSAPRGAHGRPLMSLCHPDRPRQGNMLCKQCWQRDYRLKNKDRMRAYYAEASRKYRAKHPERVAATRSRSLARKYAANSLFTLA